MSSDLKYYIDRLLDGQSEKVDLSISSEFLEVEDHRVSFPSEVHLCGEASVRGNHFLLQVNINTDYEACCKICNEHFIQKLCLQKLYLTEELKHLKGESFDATGLVRDAILLEIPMYQECSNNHCPQREQLREFLKE